MMVMILVIVQIDWKTATKNRITVNNTVFGHWSTKRSFKDRLQQNAAQTIK